MKKSAILTILLVIVLALGLGGVWRAFGRGMGLSYENADKYTAGNAVIDGAVKNLDVHWTSGDVTIAYHDEDTVELTETSKKPLSESDQLRWWLDGDTLRVQFRKPGLRLGWSLDKQLTLTLPKGAKLGTAAIELTSGDMHIPEIEANTLALESTSGDVEVVQTGSAEEVSLNSTSGNIVATLSDAAKVTADTTSGNVILTQNGAVDALRAESTSGSVSATLERMGEGAFESTSGDVDVSIAEAGAAKLSSTSGDIRVAVGAFEDLSVDTTSGSVTAELPAEPGFAGEVSSTSGSVDSAIALEKDGKTYRCGDGSAHLKIHTTSGDIHLQ